MRIHGLAGAALAVVLAGPASAGDVRGTIRFSGSPPAAPPIETNKDRTTCGPSVPDESIEVSGGHLRNVVVTVQGANLPKPPPARISLDQKACRYVPHVQATSAGSSMDIVNSDPVLHNIHGYLGTSTVFNVAMPLKNQKIPRTLSKPGIVRVKCDVHGWMSAWIVVADTPYAVVGEDGAYVITGLPAGTHTVAAWHERLGQKTAQVAVPAAGAATADFTFGE